MVIGGGGSNFPYAKLHIGDRMVCHTGHINLASPVTIGNDVGLSHDVDLITHGFWYSILDGYPRNIDQAEFLDIRFPEIMPQVVYFDISYDVLASRITGRFVCASCGAIYNKFAFNTKVEGVCDICNSKDFKIRDDDKLEVLQKRWEVYIEETKPLLEYYKNKGCLLSIDATIEKTEITNNLLKLLKL